MKKNTKKAIKTKDLIQGGFLCILSIENIRVWGPSRYKEKYLE